VQMRTQKPKGEESDDFFFTMSELRGFIADNLASGRPWYAGFSIAKTAEKSPRFIHYYRSKDNLGALWPDEKKGLLTMIDHLDDAEQALVRSIHLAIRQRFGQIASEAEHSATMHKRFEGAREKWRLAFAGAKTLDQLRAALADLWSRAGFNAELRE